MLYQGEKYQSAKAKAGTKVKECLSPLPFPCHQPQDILLNSEFLKDFDMYCIDI